MARRTYGTAGLLILNMLAVAALSASDPSASRTDAAVADQPRNGDCYRAGAALTVEEQRVDDPLPGQSQPAAAQFIDAGGFRSTLDRFERRLCTLTRVEQAGDVIAAEGAELWQRAVARAQGNAEIGTIDAYDDRPLYWARTSMKRALREWQPQFELTSLQRQAMIRQFEYASRGIDLVQFTDSDGAGESGASDASDPTRVLVSGFDTYSLDSSLRNSNPSGAAALQLDGRRVQTEQGPAVVEAVMLPVNWTDFDQGIVEDAFGPWLVPSDHPEHAGSVDLIMTISQTGRGRMDIEKWAGAFRGGSPDNNRAMNYGPISAAPLWPQPQPSPQFIETTLPYQAMIDAGTEPWPVQLNAGITEWPQGTYPEPEALRSAPDPSPGSRAASAPGGNYLSNESMYRTNRLRLAAGKEELPGGHLHISALTYPDDPAELTTPEFEADRRAIVDQTVDLVDAAARATGG